MYWNHRVVKELDGTYHLVEVSYDSDTGRMIGYNEPFLCGESYTEINKLVRQLVDAVCYRGVLDLAALRTPLWMWEA